MSDLSKVHKWIKDRRGKASFCRIDARHRSTVFEWANVSREYKYEDADWIPLCRSCHKRYDHNMFTLEELKDLVRKEYELIASLIGRPNARYVKVHKRTSSIVKELLDTEVSPIIKIDKKLTSNYNISPEELKAVVTDNCL